MLQSHMNSIYTELDRRAVCSELLTLLLQLYDAPLQLAVLDTLLDSRQIEGDVLIHNALQHRLQEAYHGCAARDLHLHRILQMRLLPPRQLQAPQLCTCKDNPQDASLRLMQGQCTHKKISMTQSQQVNNVHVRGQSNHALYHAFMQIYDINDDSKKAAYTPVVLSLIQLRLHTSTLWICMNKEI